MNTKETVKKVMGIWRDFERLHDFIIYANVLWKWPTYLRMKMREQNGR